MQTKYTNKHILLIDNGSGDGTAEVVSSKYSSVQVIRTLENVGIARGYNLGIEYALKTDADFVMVMNNDTIVDPLLIDNLLQPFRKYPKVGMTTPKIYHYFGKQNRLWCVGAKWHSFPPRIKLMGANTPDGPLFNNIRTLEFATSCCLLISKIALEDIGLFDSNYYFYYDDWDFSIRLRKKGYDILFVPDAHLWHKVSSSTQKIDKSGTWINTMGKSSVRFYLEHKSPLILILHTIWVIIRETIKLNFNHIIPYTKGVLSGLSEYRNL